MEKRNDNDGRKRSTRAEMKKEASSLCSGSEECILLTFVRPRLSAQRHDPTDLYTAR